jgi:HEAT repeat protein
VAACPTCQRDVDPIRAPAVRVIGGKVVAFCSATCADAGPKAAAKVKSGTGSASAAGTIRPRGAPISVPPPISDDDEPEITTEPSRHDDDDDDVEISIVERSSRHAVVEPEPELEPRRGRGRVLAFAAAIVVGGMAIAIVQAVSPSTPSSVGASTGKSATGSQPQASGVVDPPAPAKPSAPTTDEIGASARAVLADLVRDTKSTRVRRVAAAALARTGERAALDALGELLADETSEITRLDIGYALARGGDARGTEVLASYLDSSRRDVRADAGRMLVLLGNADGAKGLSSFLALSSHRLGAAEALSRIKDPRALEVLDAIRADENATPDDRKRATIALGRAGRADVAPELAAMLDDGRWNVGAAAALAELRDGRARAVLVKQLDVPSLRVGAAVALRRLDDQLDPAPYLPALTTALGADKDIARVAAAEAILVLTGPRAWAERD